jgi:hypothetical protein
MERATWNRGGVASDLDPSCQPPFHFVHEVIALLSYNTFVTFRFFILAVLWQSQCTDVAARGRKGSKRNDSDLTRTTDRDDAAAVGTVLQLEKKDYKPVEKFTGFLPELVGRSDDPCQEEFARNTPHQAS